MGFFDKLFGKAKSKADLNNDGQVNMADLNAAKDQAMKAADVNNDGAVNSQDLGAAANEVKDKF